jgi:protein-S-isoprenylcysteine O-methyltransferase Ste14
MEVFLKLIILWILYFIIHSVFASRLIKDLFNRYFQTLSKYYRIIYVVFAIIGLLMIVMYQSTLPQITFFETNTFITFVGLGLASLGLIIVKESFIHYDTFEFLGLKQMKGDPREQGFIRQGILNYIRHPLYSGSMLLLIGYFIFAPSIINLITVICMILYFVIGSLIEEKRLVHTFGDDYLKYRKEVPPFIPHLAILLIKKKGKAKKT